MESICPLCNGAGFLARELPIEHPDFGKAIPCSCKVQERLLNYRRYSGLDGINWTFETFPGNAKARQLAQQAYETRKGIWVFYSKTFGCGKTGLLVAIIRQAWQDNRIALYQSVPSMLDMLRHSYKLETFDEWMEDFKTVPILALDELHRYYDKRTEDSAEGSASWASEKLFQIIDYRYMRWDKCLTVLATNREIDLASADPLASRFSDSLRCHVIRVEGGDLRPLATKTER